MLELSLRMMKSKGQGVEVEIGEEASAVGVGHEEDAIADLVEVDLVEVDLVEADQEEADHEEADHVEADHVEADQERDHDHETGDLEVRIGIREGPGAETVGLEMVRNLRLVTEHRRMSSTAPTLTR